MNREVLEQPFPNSLIKTRTKNGQTLAYVEGVEYIRRLNEAFDGNWSFEILEHHIRGSEVIVLAKLVADGVAKMAFGGTTITVSEEEGGGITSIADDLKAAATDALKKASSLLGVGLRLYSNGATLQETLATPPTQQAPSNGSNVNNGNGRQDNGVTKRQLGAIWAISKRLGKSNEEIRQHSLDIFGVLPDKLTRQDASTVIKELKEQLASTVTYR